MTYVNLSTCWSIGDYHWSWLFWTKNLTVCDLTTFFFQVIETRLFAYGSLYFKNWLRFWLLDQEEVFDTKLFWFGILTVNNQNYLLLIFQIKIVECLLSNFLGSQFYLKHPERLTLSLLPWFFQFTFRRRNFGAKGDTHWEIFCCAVCYAIFSADFWLEICKFRETVEG